MMLVPLQTFPQTLMAGSNLLLNVVSYNCHGLKSSLPDVLELCKQFEVVCLQETWLPKQNLDLLSSISSDHYAVGLSDCNYESQIIKGRPYGGCAILYHKSL